MAGDCRSPSAPRNDDVLVRRILFGALRLGGVDPPIEVVGEAREGLFEPCPVLARRLEKRSEEHTSELQSLMRISYAVFCLKKTILKPTNSTITTTDNKTNQPLHLYQQSQ